VRRSSSASIVWGAKTRFCSQTGAFGGEDGPSFGTQRAGTHKGELV
jgi:hypothetical protein